MRALSSGLVLLTLTVGAIAKTGPIYVDPVYKFSIVAPTGWERKPHPEALAVFVEPAVQKAATAPRSESNREFAARMKRELSNKVVAHRGSRANITITARKTAAATVEAYAEETRKSAQGLKSYRIVRERPANIAGIPAIDRTVRVTLLDGDTVETREVFCLRNGSALTFAVAASPGSFEHYSGEFDQSLASVKWGK